MEDPDKLGVEMDHQDNISRNTAKNQVQNSSQEKQQHGQRGPNQKNPPQVPSLADAVVIKDEDVFFLCNRDGQVPLRGHHSFGLYYHDCRFLNGYELRLNGKKPQLLTASSRRGFMGTLQLLNASSQGKLCDHIKKEDLSIRWQRVLDGAKLTLHDCITLQNFSTETVELSITLAFRANFEDVFLIRSQRDEKLGKMMPPSWDDNVLSFLYEGTDKLYRSLRVSFEPKPQKTNDTTASFSVMLPARGKSQINVALLLHESPHPNEVQSESPADTDIKDVINSLRSSSDNWLANQTQVRSNSLFLDRILERSLRDLRVLWTRLDGKDFYAGGVPWFVALFGRDSILSALLTLAYEPRTAEQTLRLLAQYQGKSVDDSRDEQPGKILHELRVGELARKGEIPFTPYYGTIDATPLFLILLARHANWVGSLDLFRELRANVERALEWIDHYGDKNGDGYLEYESTSTHGLANHGWKDSGDGIVNVDGSLAQPPIALVEVQGYVYRAKLDLADLYQREGEAGRAEQLRRQARALQERFNRDFWMEDKQFFALALQKGGKQAAVISSNPGQALWTGIVDPEKAKKTVERLMASDQFSGWGIRTLSSKEQRYNPLGYHLGTVWPHDNSLIAAGFRRYGFDQATQRIFTGITTAAINFHAYRLPEVFSGFRQDDFGVPVRYPVACHPQAWAAAAVPFLLETMLGLFPEGLDHRLRIVRPLLPEATHSIELRQLRVGRGCADLRFQRMATGSIEVQILKTEGGLEVNIETKKES